MGLQHSDYVKLKADNDGLTKALNDAYSSNDDTTAATLKTFNTAFKDLPKVGENNKAALSALSAIRKTMGLYPAELDLKTTKDANDALSKWTCLDADKKETSDEAKMASCSDPKQRRRLEEEDCHVSVW